MNYRDLQDKYPAAAYSYFRIVNIKSAFSDYVNSDGDKAPRFRYGKYLSQALIKIRKRQLQSDYKTTPANTVAAKFLARRLKETKLLEAFINLRKNKVTPIPQDKIITYEKMQQELYGSLDPSIFNGIINHLQKVADSSRDRARKELMAEIRQRVKTESAKPLYLPKHSTFLHYKKLWPKVDANLHSVLNKIDHQRTYNLKQIASLFREALKVTGGAEQGWKVIISGSGTKVAVWRHNKRVAINRQITPKSSFRLKQIIAHEVGAHVRRTMALPESLTIDARPDEEGLGLFLEQLLANRFIYKRTMRYFAISLGFGIDGTKRNFKETYEIIWRAMMVLGNDEQTARERAFYETARAFRGGLPEVVGLVYIKDKIYLESNLELWQKLEKKLLNEHEFQQLLDGHDNMRRQDA